MGAAPPMIPGDLSVVTPDGEKQINVQMISDPKLTPLLAGMVFFNGLTQNTTYGEGTTLRLSGTIDIAGTLAGDARKHVHADRPVHSRRHAGGGRRAGTVSPHLLEPLRDARISNASRCAWTACRSGGMARIENAWAETTEAGSGRYL